MFFYSANFLLGKKKSIKTRKRFQILHGKQRNKKKKKTKRNEMKQKKCFHCISAHDFSLFSFLLRLCYTNVSKMHSIIFFCISIGHKLDTHYKKKRRKTLIFSSSFFPCSISHFLCFLPSTFFFFNSSLSIVFFFTFTFAFTRFYFSLSPLLLLLLVYIVFP